MAMLLAMSAPAAGEYINAPSGLNLRAGPSTEAEVIEVVPFAEEVSGTVSDGWMKTEKGYLKADFLSEDNPLAGWIPMGRWHLTAYYETGMATASGVYPERGNTLAHNTLPFRTEVYNKGHGVWTVHDRGPASMGSEWCDL